MLLKMLMLSILLLIIATITMTQTIWQKWHKGTRMLIKLAQKRHWSVIRKCWKWLASVVSKWRGSQRCISSNRRPPGFRLWSWSWFWFSGLTFFRISLIILAKWRPPGFWLWSWSWLLGSSFSKSLWQFWSPEKLHPSSTNGEHVNIVFKRHLSSY